MHSIQQAKVKDTEIKNNERTATTTVENKNYQCVEKINYSSSEKCKKVEDTLFYLNNEKSDKHFKSQFKNAHELNPFNNLENKTSVVKTTLVNDGLCNLSDHYYVDRHDKIDVENPLLNISKMHIVEERNIQKNGGLHTLAKNHGRTRSVDDANTKPFGYANSEKRGEDIITSGYFEIPENSNRKQRQGKRVHFNIQRVSLEEEMDKPANSGYYTADPEESLNMNSGLLTNSFGEQYNKLIGMNETERYACEDDFETKDLNAKERNMYFNDNEGGYVYSGSNKKVNMNQLPNVITVVEKIGDGNEDYLNQKALRRNEELDRSARVTFPAVYENLDMQDKFEHIKNHSSGVCRSSVETGMLNNTKNNVTFIPRIPHAQREIPGSVMMGARNEQYQFDDSAAVTDGYSSNANYAFGDHRQTTFHPVATNVNVNKCMNTDSFTVIEELNTKNFNGAAGFYEYLSNMGNENAISMNADTNAFRKNGKNLNHNLKSRDESSGIRLRNRTFAHNVNTREGFKENVITFNNCTERIDASENKFLSTGMVSDNIAFNHAPSIVCSKCGNVLSCSCHNHEKQIKLACWETECLPEERMHYSGCCHDANTKEANICIQNGEDFKCCRQIHLSSSRPKCFHVHYRKKCHDQIARCRCVTNPCYGCN